eukprot:4512999-Pyramimonas_sp.AAC.1
MVAIAAVAPAAPAGGAMGKRGKMLAQVAAAGVIARSSETPDLPSRARGLLQELLGEVDIEGELAELGDPDLDAAPPAAQAC